MKRPLVRSVAVFLLGVLIGGYLFADSQKRSFLTAPQCRECLSGPAFAGLVGSVVVLKTPAFIPQRIYETDRTLVFAHPRPSYPKHFVFVPKKDIKNIGDVGADDQAYIADLMATMTTVIREQKLSTYTVWSNGPGMQNVEYLHFHVGGR